MIRPSEVNVVGHVRPPRALDDLVGGSLDPAQQLSRPADLPVQLELIVAEAATGRRRCRCPSRGWRRAGSASAAARWAVTPDLVRGSRPRSSRRAPSQRAGPPCQIRLKGSRATATPAERAGRSPARRSGRGRRASTSTERVIDGPRPSGRVVDVLGGLAPPPTRVPNVSRSPLGENPEPTCRLSPGNEAALRSISSVEPSAPAARTRTWQRTRAVARVAPAAAPRPARRDRCTSRRTRQRRPERWNAQACARRR